MLEPNFSPFPELTSERLILRKVNLIDAPSIFFLRSDPVILKYLDKEPASSIKEAEEFISLITNNADNNEGIMWAIVLKKNPEKLIGSICYWRLQKENFRAELGYVLDPAYWRKGIMKEAIQVVLEYGFNIMGLHSVEARINSLNTASAAVLESTGFRKEAHFKEDFYFKGKFEDTIVYSRLQKK